MGSVARKWAGIERRRSGRRYSRSCRFCDSVFRLHCLGPFSIFLSLVWIDVTENCLRFFAHTNTHTHTHTHGFHTWIDQGLGAGRLQRASHHTNRQVRQPKTLICSSRASKIEIDDKKTDEDICRVTSQAMGKGVEQEEDNIPFQRWGRLWLRASDKLDGLHFGWCHRHWENELIHLMQGRVAGALERVETLFLGAYEPAVRHDSPIITASIQSLWLTFQLFKLKFTKNCKSWIYKFVNLSD